MRSRRTIRTMKQSEKLLQFLLASGVRRAAVLDAAEIVYDTSFRELCAQNSCGRYGTCYMCPPDIGPIEELIAAAKKYSHAVMYQNVYPLEDSFDFEGMGEAKKEHHACAQKLNAAIRELLPQGYLHLEAGGCGVCQRCAKLDDQPCRFPDKALSSLESYGIDVYQTAKKVDLPYINGQNTVTYFGLVLFTEAPDA